MLQCSFLYVFMEFADLFGYVHIVFKFSVDRGSTSYKLSFPVDPSTLLLFYFGTLYNLHSTFILCFVLFFSHMTCNIL